MTKDDHVAVQGEQAAQHRRRRLPARPAPGQPAGPRAPCCSGISAPQNLFVPMGDLYANTTTLAFCHIVTLDHGIKKLNHFHP